MHNKTQLSRPTLGHKYPIHIGTNKVIKAEVFLNLSEILGSLKRD